jgi:hypothetical protein
MAGEVGGANGSAPRICSSTAPARVTSTPHTRQPPADLRASCAYKLERHAIVLERRWDVA